MTPRKLSHTLRALLGVAFMGGAGCTPLVVLGSDCPGGREEACADTQGPPDARPKPSEDAASPDAAVEDAGAPSDGGHDMPDAVALNVFNPDFERNGGLGGDLLLHNLLGSINPLPNVVFAELPHWYACWVLSVSSVSWELDDAGVPQRVGDYLSFVINNIAVRQELPEPMRAGTKYALAMDVVSQPDNGASLYVAIKGASAMCADGRLLGRSELLPAHTGWTTTCVEFTADADYTHLLIVPGYEGPVPSGNARLLLDTLRPVPSCASAP